MLDQGYTFLWPDIFITGEVPPDISDAALCGQALLGWGNAMAARENHSPPSKFWQGMAAIADRFDVSGTPESFFEWANKNRP